MHILPKDLQKNITASLKVKKVWESITPLAKNEWICWATSGKKRKSERLESKKHFQNFAGEYAVVVDTELNQMLQELEWRIIDPKNFE